MRRLKLANVLKVARWEFGKSVRTPTFIILTLVIPLIMLLVGGVGYLTARTTEGTPTELAVLDHTEDFYRELTEYLQRMRGTVNLTVTRHHGPREQLEAEVMEGQYDGFLEVDEESIRTGEISYFVPGIRDASPQISRGLLSVPVTSYRLKRLGLDREEIDAATVPVAVRTVSLEPGDGIGGLIGPIAVAMVLMFSALFSGQILMYGVLKEKRNRIVEILLSSISSLEILVGKMIGYGVLGLVQIAVWIGAGLLVAVHFLNLQQVTMGAADVFIYCIYFLLGYALLASLFAAMGATMKDAEEGSQAQGLVVIIPIIPVFISGPLFLSPDALWARVLSHIPPFIPATVLIRMAATRLPTWEIITTLVALTVSVVVFVLAAARIFSRGILQFDRNASLCEIRRMLTG